MENYKLTYFNFTGRGEPIRLLFTVAGVEFEDYRIPFEDWPEFKKTLPYGQLPILEFDGILLTQSNTIGRYLSRKFGLHGRNELESAKVEEYIDAWSEYVDMFGRFRRATDDDEKEEGYENFLNVATPKYMTKFSQILKENGGQFLVGNSLTYADIYLYCFIQFLEAAIHKELTKDYPIIKEFLCEMSDTPKVKEWILKRPKTVK